MNNIRIVKRKIDSLKAPDTSFKKKTFRPIKEMPAVVEKRIKPLYKPTPDTSFEKLFRPIKEMPAVVEKKIKPLIKPIHT